MTNFPSLSKQTWPHEGVKGDLDSFYGNPRGSNGANPTWEKQNLVKLTLPWQADERTFSIHRKCAESLTRILQAIWNYYKQDQSQIDKIHLNEFGGSYNYRPNVNSPSNLSLHAYGAAVDLAPDENPNGKAWKDDGTMLPRPVIDAFLAEGWCWGGDFSGTKDAMHFQATFNSHSDAPQDQPAGGMINVPSVEVLPPANQELDKIKQFLSTELGFTNDTEALRTAVLAGLQELSDVVKNFGKTQVSAKPVVIQENWFVGITATVFGGSSDPNNSAYDNHFITDQEFGVAVPFHCPKPLPQFEVRGPLGSKIVSPVDVGPWYDNRPGWPYDPWFLTSGTRPRAESDHRTNGAGIDLTPALARAVGVDGKGKVDVRYIPATEGVQKVADQQQTAVVPVESPLGSKINWTALVSMAATLLTIFSGGKLNLTPDQQLAIVGFVGTVGPIATMIFRTFATKSVTPQSL